MTGSSERDADVLPISVPSRAELWRRNQLARSLLSHRKPEEAVRVALAVLAGEQPPEVSA